MRLAATLLPESDGLLFGLPKLLLILVSWTVSLQDGADLVFFVFRRQQEVRDHRLITSSALHLSLCCRSLLEPRAAARSPSALGLRLRVSRWHQCSAGLEQLETDDVE